MPHTRVQRTVAAVAVGLLALGGLTACGDDDDAGNGSETTAPEDVKAPMSEVLAGLPVIVDHGAAAASAGATGDYTTALAEYDELHQIWLRIEGTIKDTDIDVYERMETAQGLIKDGAEHDNSERIQQGADDQEIAANEFLSAQAQSGGTTGGPNNSSSTSTSSTVEGAGDVYATDEGMTS